MRQMQAYGPEPRSSGVATHASLRTAATPWQGVRPTPAPLPGSFVSAALVAAVPGTKGNAGIAKPAHVIPRLGEPST